MRYLVYVQGPRGAIVWRCPYDDIDEMLSDIKMLEKPCLYGTPDFRIVIQTN